MDGLPRLLVLILLLGGAGSELRVSVAAFCNAGSRSHAGTTTPVRPAADESSRQFVRRLMERRQFGLAENFCQKRLQSAATPSRQAVWETLLVECLQRRSWQEDSASRGPLLHYAAERVTEFLQQTVVPPVAELRLRLLQIRTLIVLAEQQDVVDRAGRRHRRSAMTDVAGAVATVRRNDHIAAVLESAAGRTAALRDQLQQIQRDLPPTVVRAMRNEARLAQAEIALYRSHHATDPQQRHEWLQEAEHEAEALLRNAAATAVHHAARQVVAAAAMERSDADAAALRVDALESQAASTTEHMDAVASRVHLLLSDSRTRAAAERLRTAAARFRFPDDRMHYLACEVALADFELIDQLSDTSQRGRAAESVEERLQRARSATQGVWRDAVERTALRFDHVRILGVAAADLLESVDRFVADGDAAAAARELDRILRQLPAGISSTAEGMLRTRRGELSVSLQEWPEAAGHLSEARALLTTAGRDDLAAAASALRCYAIGRHWQQELDDRQRQQEYDLALVDHISRYPKAPPTATVREWLIRLRRHTQPLSAAAELLHLAEQRGTAANAATDMTHAAVLLIQRISGPGDLTESQPDADPIVQSFLEHEWWSRTSADDSTPESTVAFAMRTLVVLFVDGPPDGDWQQSAEVLRAGLRELPSAASATDSSQHTENRHPASDPPLSTVPPLIRTGLLLCEARGSVDSSRTTPLIRDLSGRPFSDRRTAARLLAPQLRAETPRPGDTAIAQAIQRLLDPRDVAGLAASDALELLPTLLRAAEVTGRSESAAAVLDRLADENLSANELTRIGSLLNSFGRCDTPPLSLLVEPVRTFWIAMARRNAQGSDAWLEASLQRAQLESDCGNLELARRMLGIMSVLAPRGPSAPWPARIDALRTRIEDRTP